MTDIDRVDGLVKATGAARYAADHRFDDLAHGHLVLSTIGKGTITSMDVAAARRAPGVLAVFTPFDALPLHGPITIGLAPILGESRLPLQQPGDRSVGYHGQIIGLVIARTWEQARDAAALFKTEYAAQQPQASLRDGTPEALPQWKRMEILADGVRGIDEALESSHAVAGGTYSQPPKHHNAMEPHATVAIWQGERLTLHSATQGPAAHSWEMAAALGVEEKNVHVVCPHVGGAFGGKATTWAPAVLAAAAARECGVPVKIVVTREQLYTVTGHRPAVYQTVRIGAARDGAVNAVKFDAVSSVSRAGGVVEFPGRVALTAYKTPNLYVDNRGVQLDFPPSTIMRAPTDEPGSFAMESAMDELAVELGMDPIELRLKNDLIVAFPRPPEESRSLPFSSKHLDECYRVGAERFGWDKRRATPGTVRDGDWLIGLGMSAGVLGASRSPYAMRVMFRANGTVAVDTASADLGTGLRTVLAAVCADSLGIPVAKVKAGLGDSTLPVERSTPYSGYGAVGSGSTGKAAPAVREVAQAATKALIEHAITHARSPFQGMDPAGVRYEDGVLRAGDRAVGFGELLTLTGTREMGASEVSKPEPGPSQYTFASFVAHFCEVRVNRWTREPRLSRFLAIADAGAIVNVKTARGQIAGSVAFGVGHALLEGTRIEAATGRTANANLADYLIPTNADLPNIEVHFLNHPDTALSPVGARGIGELGTIGSAAAVANAIYNATGKRVRDLPITIDKLLA
ncbi:xanthine dehydrogenase family protein molybdopterin-binding subunit [Nonomuraea sp. 3N208]|uniref:xanthine dehydrogenase family protein molybdopterin-binding subunit n=1 Tax=Nonomuraea sp. 3N208 TaxID=3457421 RepID=UPI003FCFD066